MQQKCSMCDILLDVPCSNPLCDVTDCVKMYENRQFENAGSNRLDQASLASMIGDADDAQSREVYGSIWPRMRKLLPSMTTVSA